MAAGDINSWRRQNSDVVAVILVLENGTVLRGNLLQPRDKSLRELFSMPDPFIDFEDASSGEMVLAKKAVVSVRKHDLPVADQLDKKISLLEKADPYRILGVGKSASRDEIHTAYLALARAYHPDRFAAVGLPPEVAEYVETMTRRINVAYSELSATGRQASADAADAAATQDAKDPKDKAKRGFAA